MERVLGIDPGLNICGYGLIVSSERGPRLHEAGIIRGRTKGDVPSRVKEIHDGITEVIAALKPTAVAIEELFSHYARPKTAILMGHARGVICLAAAQADLAVTGYAATQVKKILTGSGRAPKNQMQQAICRELALQEVPEPADVADALAIALCHYYLSKRALQV